MVLVDTSQSFTGLPSSTDEGLTSPERSARQTFLVLPLCSPVDMEHTDTLCVPCVPLVEKNNGCLVVDL